MQKAIIKKGFSKNSWNKVKLQNRYRARWAKGKTGIGLDGHRARQSLIGLSAHCANSYIPHVQHIIQYICAAGFISRCEPTYVILICVSL